MRSCRLAAKRPQTAGAVGGVPAYLRTYVLGRSVSSCSVSGFRGLVDFGHRKGRCTYVRTWKNRNVVRTYVRTMHVSHTLRTYPRTYVPSVSLNVPLFFLGPHPSLWPLAQTTRQTGKLSGTSGTIGTTCTMGTIGTSTEEATQLANMTQSSQLASMAQLA